jgi:hypothetical protein
MDRRPRGRLGRATAAALGAGAVGRDVVEWHRLRAGRGDFDEAVADFSTATPTGPAWTSCGAAAKARCPMAAGRTRSSPSSRQPAADGRGLHRARLRLRGAGPERRGGGADRAGLAHTADDDRGRGVSSPALRPAAAAAPRGAARHAPLAERDGGGRTDAAARVRRLAEARPRPHGAQGRSAGR